ncbi:unnamed protein product [Ceutorhynchus assimilis]|uniref:Uncharacterized protein n=1 Tax=Ceutorhynchus assimilis TaxID=467358 RepID=A0A9N9MBE6_9CUCU|nr:unnamed protein product [Ceutorhynchus assimilis]
MTSKEKKGNQIIPIIDLKEIENLKSRIHEEIDCDETKLLISLIKALANNDVGKVAIILEKGSCNANRRLPEYCNGTLLHLAASTGNVQIAYLLILNQIDINVLNSAQNSALMVAIKAEKNEMIQYLVHAGADLTLKGIDGMTCLHVAAEYGNLEACKVILDSSFAHKNFVNLQDDNGWTPLAWACDYNFFDIAKYFISNGADINIRDVQHNVPLHWAAFKGNTQVVELLLSFNADINVQNVHGDTPLHLSARDDHYNCVIMLLSRKADVSTINSDNSTALNSSVANGLCFSTLKLATELNLKDKSKATGLLSSDISRGRELNPIPCYNNVDNEKEPNEYTYITKNCQSSNSFQIDTKLPTIKSCTCVDICKSTECNCAKLSLKCWYNQGKLIPDFNLVGEEDSPTIFECNDFCTCNAILCNNRLVQKSSTERFELLRTTKKGWSVKTLSFIPMGNYVCEYIGEILTDMEADRREDDAYLFDLDNKDTDSFCIDAKFYGNFSRFINHSCEPNLHPVKVFVEHHDRRFPRIALFAKNNIEANQELSFDYGERFWQVKRKWFTCECGTSSCKYSKDTIGATLGLRGARKKKCPVSKKRRKQK